MTTFRLFLKLAIIPFRRSWVVLGLMVISLAQLMLGLWYCGSLQNEIRHTEAYAQEAKLITVQMKEGEGGVDPIRALLEGQDATLEEWKAEAVLSKMEQEEPELVETVRSIGLEGLQLLPRLLVVRGVVSDEIFGKIKMMTEVARVDSSPVHHARLKSFYQHLGLEVRIAVVLLLILAFVQLIVFQRIQSRDSSEVVGNLVAWGVPSGKARIPALLSMVSLSGIAGLLSVMEWFLFRNLIWRNNAFLGELSLDHSLSFPWVMVAFTFVVLSMLSFILVFSGRIKEE